MAKNQPQEAFDITASELKMRLESGIDVQLIDVRQPSEYAFARIEGAKLIPLDELPERYKEIHDGRETVIYCKMGARSARAVEYLRSIGFAGNVRNLRGGITAWSNEADPRIPKY
jgi:adenylyltransferase/sulfurtransferase